MQRLLILVVVQWYIQTGQRSEPLQKKHHEVFRFLAESASVSLDVGFSFVFSFSASAGAGLDEAADGFFLSTTPFNPPLIPPAFFCGTVAAALGLSFGTETFTVLADADAEKSGLSPRVLRDATALEHHHKRKLATAKGKESKR